jgi:hypothetical protein
MTAALTNGQADRALSCLMQMISQIKDAQRPPFSTQGNYQLSLLYSELVAATEEVRTVKQQLVDEYSEPDVSDPSLRVLSPNSQINFSQKWVEFACRPLPYTLFTSLSLPDLGEGGTILPHEFLALSPFVTPEVPCTLTN